MKDLVFDTYSSTRTVEMRIFCNYPEANTEATVYIDGLTVITSRDRTTIAGPGAFASNIPGNWTVKNLVAVDHYTTLSGIAATWILGFESIWVPDDDLIQTVILDGVTLSVDNDDGSKFSLIVNLISSDHYRQVMQYHNNIDIFGFEKTIFAPYYMIGSALDTLYINNLKIHDSEFSSVFMTAIGYK